MILTEIHKRRIVQRLIESQTFKNAPTSISLLKYLSEATIKDVDLKESVIDIEFFNNQDVSDRTSPRVRVNVHNLRKKIAQYYEDEGKHDFWRLAIDKGQYKTRFYKKELSKHFLKHLNWNLMIPYMALILVLAVTIVYNIPKKKPYLWRPFLDEKATTSLYLGDHFGLTGKTLTHGLGWTRDFSINSDDEFYNFIDKNPSLRDSLKPSKYSYTTRMAALSTQKLQEFFQTLDKKIAIRFSTQTSTSEIKEGNAIYVGPSKNNNHFIYFFNEANPYFELTSAGLKLFKHSVLKERIFDLNTSDQTHEYAIVSKYPATGRTDHFVFFSQHDIGVIATVEYFTNRDSIQKFCNEYLKDNKYFTAVFEVKGQDRTNTSLKINTVVPF